MKPKAERTIERLALLLADLNGWTYNGTNILESPNPHMQHWVAVARTISERFDVREKKTAR